MKLAWLLVATLGINSAHAAADLPVAMQQVLHDWQAPGMAIAIVHDQQVLFVGGMGKRKLGEPAAVDAHTRFAIASLTKTFTAAAVLTLVEEGKLSLDAPVKDLWPALTLSDPTVTSQLTLRDILSHRSGIDESADLLWTSTGYDRSEVLQRLRAASQSAAQSLQLQQRPVCSGRRGGRSRRWSAVGSSGPYASACARRADRCRLWDSYRCRWECGAPAYPKTRRHHRDCTACGGQHCTGCRAVCQC